MPNVHDYEAANSYERDLIARCHKLSRIACHALSFLESLDLLGQMTETIEEPFQRAELEKWWENHKLEKLTELSKQAKAKQRAARIEKALSKLTPAEQRLLRIRIKSQPKPPKPRDGA